MKAWVFLKQNFDLLLNVSGALFITYLAFLRKVAQNDILAAILAVLSLIAFSLLINRSITINLQQATTLLQEYLEKPSIDQAIVPYGEWIDTLRKQLSSAKEVWMLSRTCLRFWEDYSEEMKIVLNNNGKIRIMLVDPHSEALQMIARNAEFEHPDDKKVLEQNIMIFLSRMKNLSSRYSHHSEYSLLVKTIDYLPHWSLIFINPRKAHSTLFVELGTFSANKHNRPTFSLQKKKDEQLFWRFYNEFECMWERALPSEKSLVIESSKPQRL